MSRDTCSWIHSFGILFYTCCASQNSDTRSWRYAQVTITHVLVTIPAATAACALRCQGRGAGRASQALCWHNLAEDVKRSCLASERGCSLRQGNVFESRIYFICLSKIITAGLKIFG